MPSRYFKAIGPILSSATSRETGRKLLINVEITDAATVRTEAEIGRAIWEISVGHIPERILPSTEMLGDFALTRSGDLKRDSRSPLTSSNWPGVNVWGIFADPQMPTSDEVA